MIYPRPLEWVGNGWSWTQVLQGGHSTEQSRMNRNCSVCIKVLSIMNIQQSIRSYDPRMVYEPLFLIESHLCHPVAGKSRRKYQYHFLSKISFEMLMNLALAATLLVPCTGHTKSYCKISCCLTPQGTGFTLTPCGINSMQWIHHQKFSTIRLANSLFLISTRMAKNAKYINGWFSQAQNSRSEFI